MTGIWMSVSRRSNAPCSRVRISSASAPSCAVTMAWPSMAIARATRARMESSSSAIRTRGMGLPSLTPDLLRVAAGEIMPVEKAYIDIASFRGRRGEARLEPGAFAGLQHRLIQHRVPGVDFGALRVADGKAQPRQFDRLPGLAGEEASNDTPVVDSPPIAGDWSDPADGGEEDDWHSMARHDAPEARPRRSRRPPGLLGLPTACAAMGALVLALIVWRSDVVRLLPQTAS